MDDNLSRDVMRLTWNATRPENIIAGRCFLCGGAPTNGKGEHVFPKWLQKRFSLWNEALTLLNGSRIPYRSLKIPACEACNSQVLGTTESYVSELTGSDIAKWSDRHSLEVGRWMAKMFIGILVKEASLLHDRSSPELGTIFPPEGIDELFLIHLLVQSWRKKIKFNSFHSAHPFTLYVYQIEIDEGFSSFKVSTNLIGKSLCIRFGDLGFAFVADGGLQYEASELGPYSLGFAKLHPVQFDELAARVHYKAALRDATHVYAYSEDAECIDFSQVMVKSYTRELLEHGSQRIFRHWSDVEFAVALQHYRVQGHRYLLGENGDAIYTFLANEDGTKRDIPAGSFD